MMNNYRLPFVLRGSRRFVPRFPASLVAGLYGYTFQLSQLQKYVFFPKKNEFL